MAKILNVEDHPAQRDILAQMLELNGFQVAVASDGLEGVEKARSWLPDLILMDLRMPHMDGFEAIKILRSEEKTAYIPILVVSAWASTKHKARALVSGADEHFTKPVDLNKLLTTISRYLKADLEKLVSRRIEIQAQLAASVTEPDIPKDKQAEALGLAFAATRHDLVGLLGIIQQDVEAMMDSSATPDRLRRVWRSTRHAILLLQTVTDLLPGGPLNLEVIHLPLLIDEALDLIEPEFKGRVKVTRNYAQQLQAVKVDSLRFEQVLLNLFKNAREAKADSLHIALEKTAEEALYLSITDNGEGIVQDEVERLFELWQTTRSGEGRGVGLYIIKTILDRHGWDVQVKSKKGHGTVFSIIIPPDSLTETIETHQFAAQAEGLKFTKPKVLVVDDNADTLDLLASALQTSDYEVDTAWSLQDALFKVRQDHYDVIVTDLRFLDEADEDEGMAGLRLLAVAQEIDPPVQVIVITGFGSEAKARKAIQLGASDYIVKPINLKRLQVSILKAINARQRLLAQELAPARKGETPAEIISIIGNSRAMTDVIEQVQIAARSDEIVVIRGEGGTGKSFIAESIHALSRRSITPLHVISCTTLALEPFENIRQKLLGALSNEPKLSAETIGGTIFLDAVDELTDEAQRLLLKLMEEAKAKNQTGVRIISSLSKTEPDTLRPDLRRRLGEIEIYLAPLLERQEDIPALIGHFLRKYSLEYGLRVEMAEESMVLLQGYTYPDNVVELERIIRLAVRRARQGVILPEHLPRDIQTQALIEPHVVRIESLKRQLQQYQTNLYILEERRAQYSIDPPVSLLNEIEAMKTEIEKITVALESLDEDKCDEKGD